MIQYLFFQNVENFALKSTVTILVLKYTFRRTINYDINV